jgi:hypothetical protein
VVHSRCSVGRYSHLYRLAEAHLVAEEYSSVPSFDGGSDSLALEREQRFLECRSSSHLVLLLRSRRHGAATEGLIICQEIQIDR